MIWDYRLWLKTWLQSGAFCLFFLKSGITNFCKKNIIYLCADQGLAIATCEFCYIYIKNAIKSVRSWAAVSLNTSLNMTNTLKPSLRSGYNKQSLVLPNNKIKMYTFKTCFTMSRADFKRDFCHGYAQQVIVDTGREHAI